MITKIIMILWTAAITVGFVSGIAEPMPLESSLALTRLGIDPAMVQGWTVLLSAFFHFGVWLILAVPTYFFHMMWRRTERDVFYVDRPVEEEERRRPRLAA